MAERISAAHFEAEAETGDWRVLGSYAAALFRTGSFPAAATLVDRIATLAERLNHHPDMDVRFESVTVRLSTHELGGLSTLDLELAKEISAAARQLGVRAEPASVQEVHIAIDAMSIPAVRPFWRAVLGYAELGEEDLVDPLAIGPPIWFQQMDEPRPQRNRIHWDLYLPHDQVQERIGAAIAAGGVLVTDEFAPSWWVLADPEGNEICVARWDEREE